MLSLSTTSFFSPHKSSQICRCGNFALVTGLVTEEGVYMFTFEHDNIGNGLDICVFSLTTLHNVCLMELVLIFNMLDFYYFITYDNNPCGFNSIHTC